MEKEKKLGRVMDLNLKAILFKKLNRVKVNFLGKKEATIKAGFIKIISKAMANTILHNKRKHTLEISKMV